MDIFIIKKIAAMLFMPLPAILLLLLMSLFFVFRQHLGKAKIALFTSIGLLLITSLPPVPNTLLGATERQYHQLDPSHNIDAILILGGGHSNDGSLPLSSQIASISLYRIVEAVRLAQLYPKAPIYTSGGAGEKDFSNAEMNRRLLVALGIPDSRIIIGNESAKDTEEEARKLAPLLMDKQFALVTSASHMERAMALFEAQNLVPLAAPTEHQVKRGGEPVDWWTTLPHSNNVYKFERWWYEAMGRTWLAIKAIF